MAGTPGEGLRPSDLFSNEKVDRNGGRFKIVAEYNYTHEDGTLLFQVVLHRIREEAVEELYDFAHGNGDHRTHCHARFEIYQSA